MVESQKSDSYDNPYRSPTEFVCGTSPVIGTELASRGLRLGAYLVDGCIFGLPLILISNALGLIGQLHERGYYSAVPYFFLLSIGLFLLINGVPIYKRGQTVGKMIFGIAVVTRDFHRVSGNRYIFLRVLPVWLISSVPIIGGIFRLFDALAIFRHEKNCLHDDIAGTRVIEFAKNKGAGD